MAIKFCDSFDLYSTLAQKWDIVQGTAVISAGSARNGSHGMSCFANGNYVQKNIANVVTYFVGFAINVQTGAAFTGNTDILRFMDGSTVQVNLALGVTGQLIVQRGGTALLGTASGTLSFGVWHYIEIEVVISTTVGVVNLRVDGGSVLALTSQNTQQTGNVQTNGVWIGNINGSNNYTFWFDDVYFLDTTGAANTTFLGDTKIQGLLPSGNGTLNNYTQNAAAWVASTPYAVGATIIDSNGALQRCTIAGTSKVAPHPTWATVVGNTTTDNSVTWVDVQNAALSNFNFVNENPPDDNSSYLSDATVTDQDRYTFPAASGTSAFAVVVNIRAEKDDAGARSIRAVTKSGATVADNGADFVLTQGVYADFQGIFETDPNTSAQWTIANVNAAEFGVKTTV